MAATTKVFGRIIRCTAPACTKPRIGHSTSTLQNGSLSQRIPKRTYASSAQSSSKTPASGTTSAPGGYWSTLFVLFTGSVIGATIHAVIHSRSTSSTSTQPSSAQHTPLPSPSIPPQYASKTTLETAIAELRAELGEDFISTDPEDLHSHGYSEWSSINTATLPVAVCYPHTTADVSFIARVASKYLIPLIPYSGGSSLEANFSAPHGGFSIDFAFMDAILEIHEDDMDVVVQPSVQWMELNEKLKHTGLFFPVDPGPSAKIGGMVGTSCSGTNAFRYGTMRDWVINLTVVLADGTVIKTRKRPRKTSAGYNLTGMFVGAEGTLGIVTEATLKLAVIPQETKVGVVTFPSIRHAASAAMQIIRAGIPVAAMEIMDDVQMAVINKAGGTNRVWEEVPTLFFKFSGTPAGIRDNIEGTTRIAKWNGGGKMIYAKTEQEGRELWKARKDSLWSMLMLRREGDEVWSTDVAVPISRLPDIVEISKKEIDELGLFASVLGHIGDGNFHTSILYNRSDPEERARVEKVVYDMVGRALEMEGTCTGEHGIGIGKKASLIEELGEETVAFMRAIKRAVDPHWLMNPGKIFDWDAGVTATKKNESRTVAAMLERTGVATR